MFLKRNRRRKGGQTYEYWSLVQTVRTAKGPRHRTVCNLGKLPADQQHRYGWEDLIDLLEGTELPPKQQVLGTAHCTKNDFKCSGEKSIIRKAIVSKQAPSRRFKPHNCRTWVKRSGRLLGRWLLSLLQTGELPKVVGEHGPSDHHFTMFEAFARGTVPINLRIRILAGKNETDDTPAGADHGKDKV